MCYVSLDRIASTLQRYIWMRLILFASGNSMRTVVPHADIFFSIALYGLILFYDLTKEELAGRRPLAKFLSIKLVVIFTFYQSFVARSAVSIRRPSLICICFMKFTLMENRVIHGTEFWTPTNIADGLDSLAVCIEACLFNFFLGLPG
jgi:Organic solute transporter Ostalpha